jgi:molecular chaperone GrpE (heat shock protein)
VSEEQWTTIGKQLDDLSDLFRRRLLDDRAARDARQFLEKRIAQLESALSADDLRPTVRAIAQVVDRLEDNRAEHEVFAESIIEELIDVMDTLGVSEIDTQADYDPRRHTVASVRGGEGSALKIVEVVRRGWEGHGVVLRQAFVVVEKASPLVSPGLGSGG